MPSPTPTAASGPNDTLGRLYCNSSKWHLQGDKCTNSAEDTPGPSAAYDTLGECCLAVFSAECGPEQIENVCDLEHLDHAEYAEAVASEGGAEALGCDPSPCQPLEDMDNMVMNGGGGEAAVGIPMTEGDAADKIEPENAQGEEGDASYCDSGKWHLDQKSGKCTNHPGGMSVSLVFDTPGGCCFKHFVQECEADQVKNVCDLDFVADVGGTPATEKEASIFPDEQVVMAEGAAAAVLEEDEGGVVGEDEKIEDDDHGEVEVSKTEKREDDIDAFAPPTGATPNNQDTLGE